MRRGGGGRVDGLGRRRGKQGIHILHAGGCGGVGRTLPGCWGCGQRVTCVPPNCHTICGSVGTRRGALRRPQIQGPQPGLGLRLRRGSALAEAPAASSLSAGAPKRRSPAGRPASQPACLQQRARPMVRQGLMVRARTAPPLLQPGPFPPPCSPPPLSTASAAGPRLQPPPPRPPCTSIGCPKINVCSACRLSA